MTMVSYAQNHEDVLLDRAFPRGKPGFYIDVGANEPVRNSVTKHFYELGWHGINVEPGAHPFALLAAERQRDVNLNVAVSDTEGELTLYELPPDLSGGSTLSEANAARHREAGHPAPGRTVATLTLAQLCERHAPATIGFLSVDVEGHEREVLAGGDWEKWRPRNPTSPHWYDETRLQRYLAAHVARDRDLGRHRTVREFIAEFRGLSGTAVQRKVLEDVGCSHQSLADFELPGNTVPFVDGVARQQIENGFVLLATSDVKGSVLRAH